jgi:hypothetical protein
MKRYLIALLAAACQLFAGYASLEAQIIYGTPASLGGRVVIQHWKLTASNGKDTTLTQIVMPVSYMLPLAPHWELHLDAAPSNSKLVDNNTSTSVFSAGLSTARAFHSFANDRLFVAGGLILPTGKTSYDTLQVRLAQLVADDYLNVPLKQLGGGFGFLAQVGGASQHDWLLFGGSAGYTYQGAYKYLQNGDKYNPGDEIVVQGSASAVAASGSVDLDVAYRYYTADKVGSVQVFKAGGIASAVLSGTYNFRGGSAGLILAEVLRSKNSLQFGDALRSEDDKTSGNKTILAGNATYDFVPQWSFSILAEYRFVTANDYPVTSEKYFGQSDLFSLGGGVSFRDAADHYSLFSKIVFSTGEANKSGLIHQSVSISGFELTLGGRIRF